MQTGGGLEEEPESSRRGREGESMPLLIAQWLFQNVDEINPSTKALVGSKNCVVYHPWFYRLRVLFAGRRGKLLQPRTRLKAENCQYRSTNQSFKTC